jgi:HEAT repeat protein
MTGPPDRSHPLIQLLNDMETLRRLLRLYPGEHPALGPARDRLAASAAALAATGATTISVSTGQVVFNGEELAIPPSLPCHRLVAFLFQLGIAAVRLTFPAAGKGLSDLVGRLATTREPPGETERLALFKAAEGIAGVDLVALDLSSVQLVDAEAVTRNEAPRFAWSELARRIEARGGFLFSGKVWEGYLAPGVVADLLNEVPDKVTLLDHLFSQVAEVVKATPESQRGLMWREARAFLGELLALLDADRRCLAIAAAAKHLPLGGYPRDGLEPLVRGEVLLDAVEYMLRNDIQVPEVVQRAVYRLAAPPSDQPVALPEAIVQRARLLLHRLPLAGPDQALGDSGFALSVDELADAAVGSSGAAELLAAVSESELHSHLLRVLGEAVTLWPREPVGGRAAMRLAEELVSALEIGDVETAARLAPLASAAPSAEARELACTSGVAAAVRALRSGDRQSIPAIVTILVTLGDRAIPLVLEALAEEENLAVRKRLLEAVARQGDRAIPHLLPLLDDPRWFVVRNAVFVLRRLGYRDMLPRLKAALATAPPQVAAEALKAMVAFQDPDWLRLLQRQIDSPDERTQLAALNVASRIRHPQVVRALVERLRQRLSARVREEPATIELIRALGRLRDGAALAVLQQVTDLKAWRYPFSIAGLRREAAVAIAGLEGAEARQVATALAGDRDTQLAAAVRAAMQRPAAAAEDAE